MAIIGSLPGLTLALQSAVTPILAAQAGDKKTCRRSKKWLDSLHPCNRGTYSLLSAQRAL